MASFSFEVEFRKDETNPIGEPVIRFELVAHISAPNLGKFSYPMTAKYVNGIVTHETKKVERDFPHVQLRRDLISNMKMYVKSQL